MEGFMKKQISKWVRAMGMVTGVGAIISTLLFVGCASTSESGGPRFSEPPADLFPTNVVADAGGGAGAANGSAGLSVLKPEGDRLRVGDRVTVKFSGNPDQQNLPTHEQVIKDDGTITLPYIQDVKAVGKTLGQLQKEIHDQYVPAYYKRLTITILGEQRVYYVGGQVRNPGRQFYVGATTVTKAIQSAGDFTDFAAKTRVELTRVSGQRIEVNCIKAAKDPALDLAVYPGDKIAVPQHTFWDLFR